MGISGLSGTEIGQILSGIGGILGPIFGLIIAIRTKQKSKEIQNNRDQNLLLNAFQMRFSEYSINMRNKIRKEIVCYISIEEIDTVCDRLFHIVKASVFDSITKVLQSQDDIIKVQLLRDDETANIYDKSPEEKIKYASTILSKLKQKNNFYNKIQLYGGTYVA